MTASVAFLDTNILLYTISNDPAERKGQEGGGRPLQLATEPCRAGGE